MVGNYLLKEIDVKYLSLGLLLLLPTCSVLDNEQNLENATVIGTANNPIFSVINKSEKSIFYFILESNDAALFDPEAGFPCNNYQPNLDSKQSVQINYSNIPGWAEGEDSVWFMWTDCNGSGD